MLLTDKLPVEMPANTNWGTKHLFDKPVIPPSEINPDVNKGLEQIVMQSLEKEAECRYPTAKELLDNLEQWKPDICGPSQKAKTSSRDPSKSAIGLPSPANEKEAHDLSQRAFNARQCGRLAEAADLMEEAFNKSPNLRTKFAHQVKLWRCGISM
jgi:serine/threonine-protein kinase